MQSLIRSLKIVLRGVCSLTNYSVANEETQSLQFSWFCVFFFFSKGNPFWLLLKSIYYGNFSVLVTNNYNIQVSIHRNKPENCRPRSVATQTLSDKCIYCLSLTLQLLNQSIGSKWTGSNFLHLRPLSSCYYAIQCIENPLYFFTLRSYSNFYFFLSHTWKITVCTSS